jgi:hypothetical protein
VLGRNRINAACMYRQRVDKPIPLRSLSQYPHLTCMERRSQVGLLNWTVRNRLGLTPPLSAVRHAATRKPSSPIVLVDWIRRRPSARRLRDLDTLIRAREAAAFALRGCDYMINGFVHGRQVARLDFKGHKRNPRACSQCVAVWRKSRRRRGVSRLYDVLHRPIWDEPRGMRTLQGGRTQTDEPGRGSYR